MSGTVQSLLPDGAETTFPEIEATMARLAGGGASSGSLRRPVTTAATATVVIVGPKARLIDVATLLKSGGLLSGARSIFIASGALCTPGVRVTATEIALDGLRGEFIDNAVGALRLPSLPTVLWWRGGDPERLQALAKLVDRVVLDAEDPTPLWSRIDALIAEGPVADLRWTALTRWRVLMAHFFDMPAIQSAAGRFTRMRIAGRDRHSARLFAAWLLTSLKLQNVRPEIVDDSRDSISLVTLSNDAEEIALRRLEDSACVEGRARVNGREASRLSTMGDQNMLALMAEELRVRTHDPAFEAAVRGATRLRPEGGAGLPAGAPARLRGNYSGQPSPENGAKVGGKRGEAEPPSEERAGLGPREP